MTISRLALITATAGLLISGCSSLGKTLGVTKESPNEFNILTKAPLVVPPEYNLRPPALDASNSQDNYSSKAAREAILGEVDPAKPSQGEIIFMTQAGVGASNPEIRLEIDGENSVERKTDAFTNRVLNWENGVVVGASAPLDPEREAARLRAVESATGGGQVQIQRRPGQSKLPGL